MTKFDYVFQAARKIQEALEVYTCARNKDAGVCLPYTEKRLRSLLTHFGKELDKYREKPKKTRKSSTKKSTKPTCCVCGKELSHEDINYYDLSSYCIDCAIKDGIRTSK